MSEELFTAPQSAPPPLEAARIQLSRLFDEYEQNLEDCIPLDSDTFKKTIADIAAQRERVEQLEKEAMK